MVRSGLGEEPDEDPTPGTAHRWAGVGVLGTEDPIRNRVISVGSITLERLQEHRQRQKLEKAVTNLRWQEIDLIFPTTIGDPHNLLKCFKDLLAKAGLPNMRFHDLRHTAATLMLQENIHPKVVQERLGHSDISLTLNTYSHVLPGMQEEAATKLDELVTLVEVGSGQSKSLKTNR